MSRLAKVASIPISFLVESVFAIEGEVGGTRGTNLVERPVPVPYLKDYDALPDAGPGAWSGRFDVSNWGLISAWSGHTRVGTLVLAWRTAGLDMLDGHEDAALIWDLRVAPEARGEGVGSSLMHAAEAWARDRACNALRVETQNVNVPACRFYAGSGFQLVSVDRQAYPTLPEEIQLIWSKGL